MSGFASLGLLEHGQHDDFSAWGDPVGETQSLAAQVEAQLPQLPNQVLAVRLRQEWAPRGKQSEVELNTAAVPFRQIRNPIAYFIVKMNAALGYIIHDIHAEPGVG